MDERTRERHSVGCYFCGTEFDERNGQDASPYNNDDGGSICPSCRRQHWQDVAWARGELQLGEMSHDPH